MACNPWRARSARATRRVAAILLALPDDDHYVRELSARAQVGCRSTNIIVKKMLGVSWLTTGFVCVSEDGYPSRRIYRVTESGRLWLTDIVRGDRQAAIDPQQV